jgi:predicted MPP superfamily phosphohydrolase
MVFLFFFLALVLLLNGYVLFATWNHFGNTTVSTVWRSFVVFMMLWEIASFVVMSYQFREAYGKSSLLSNILMGATMAFLVAKICIILFLFGNDLYRFLKWPFERIFSNGEVRLDERRKFITNLGLVTAAIPFTGLIYGAIRGKYSYKVWKHTLKFDALPKAFHGMRIAQLSDIHAGSLDNPEAVRQGLKELMLQKPDLIVLTGDLVNNYASEADEYVSMFRDVLKAPLGKYAVMGNHDYGEYVPWKNEMERKENIQAVRDRYKAMGFELLDNRAEVLDVLGERINLIGVENWGSGRFPKYGDFDRAVQGIDPNGFNILLSHDPDHWDRKIIDHDCHVHLTFSGHTHGSQMGIEIPGFLKWSPVKYRYKRWAGLYEEKEQFLYVNRGFGFIGYPGRVGIWPEITLLTLENA